MLKRDITYTNFDDETITETFYFNLMKTELVELDAGHQGGMETFLKKVVQMKDHEKMLAEFKRIILLAYGEKTPDGKRFIKSQELRDAFSQTNAFDELFLELMSNEDKMVTFLKAILPTEVREEIQKMEQLPPPNIKPVEKPQPFVNTGEPEVPFTPEG